MSEGRSLSELIRRLGSAYMGQPDNNRLPQFMKAIQAGKAKLPENEKQPGRRTDLEKKRRPRKG